MFGYVVAHTCPNKGILSWPVIIIKTLYSVPQEEKEGRGVKV